MTVVGTSQAFAQNDSSPANAAPPESAAPASEDKAVELNAFVVSATKSGRFTSNEATSSGRIAINLFTSTQSISVITREAFEDVGAVRILDIAKYASGITESTIPNGLDRTTIRGFQTEGQTVDGFTSSSQINLDPVFVEKLEIVKGPNAVLAPSGVPGGTINNVSRKPLFSNRQSFGVSWGLYDGERGEFDVNRFTTLANHNRIAFRAVGAISDNTEGWRHATSHSVAAMPMFMLQTATGAQLTLQAVAFTGRSQNDLGLPIDPSSGTTTGAKILSGLSDKTNTSNDDFRGENRREVRGLLTASITDSLAMRLAGRYAKVDLNFAQNIPSVGLETANAAGVISPTSNPSGGGYDPRTGIYVPGKAYYIDRTTGAVTEYSALPMARTLARGGNLNPGQNTYVDVQNDYVHKLALSNVKFTSVGGYALSYLKAPGQKYATAKANINFDDVAGSASNYATSPLSTFAQTSRATLSRFTQQAYITESVSFWSDKLLLNGGLAYSNLDLAYKDPLNTGITKPQVNVDTPLRSVGVVVNPIKSVSAYYSYTENASSPDVSLGSVAAGSPPLQSGKQHEYGIRFQGWDNKVYATLAHFEIKQENFSVPNPANLVVPAPVPQLPNLFSNRIAKGWEFEARATITKQMSIMANWTHFTNRDANNLPFRGTAETSAAALANFQFPKDSSLSGFSLALGVDYRGKTPGDQPSGFSVYAFNQPSFWLPARTLVNFTLNYRASERLRVQFTVNNLLDKEYLASSINRANVYPGMRIDPQIRLTYSF